MTWTTGMIQTLENVSNKLKPYFEKHRGGEYFAHLNGSDITIYRKNSQRWDWRVDGRVNKWGSSNSLMRARVDAWFAGLNSVELDAFKKGQLPIP